MTGSDKPSSTSSPDLRRGRLFVVAGPSGVGKDTVIRELIGRWPFYLSISATTRPARRGEIDGRDYIFISEEEFDRWVEEGRFLEWNQHFEHRYGTPRAAVEEQLASGVDVVLEIEVEGAKQVKKRAPEAVFVFIEPPSMEALAERLVGRGDTGDVEARLERARREMALADGYGQSTDSWGDLLRDLKRRGMPTPMPAVGHGALGFWAALRDVWHETPRAAGLGSTRLPGCWLSTVNPDGTPHTLPIWYEWRDDVVEVSTRSNPDLLGLAPIDQFGGEEEFDAAVTLFNDRAQAVTPGFLLAHHRSAVKEICRRLDGIPLAIELAAARTQSLAPADIATLLDDRFRLLAARRAPVERHRTLRATVEWSHDLLDDNGRVLFGRLAVFAGWFDLAAVRAVCGFVPFNPFTVVETLQRLVEQSMVVVEDRPSGRRYRLLETLRRFGLEQLAPEHPEHVAERHALHYREWLEHLRPSLEGPDELRALAELDDGWDNLRAAHAWAIDHADPDGALRICAALVWETQSRTRLEAAEWALRSIDLPGAHECRWVWLSSSYDLGQDVGVGQAIGFADCATSDHGDVVVEGFHAMRGEPVAGIEIPAPDGE